MMPVVHCHDNNYATGPVQFNAAINVMPEGGGTLNVLGHPRWGIFLFINEGPGIGKFDNVKKTKANRVLNVRSLDTNVPPS